MFRVRIFLIFFLSGFIFILSATRCRADEPFNLSLEKLMEIEVARKARQARNAYQSKEPGLNTVEDKPRTYLKLEWHY